MLHRIFSLFFIATMVFESTYTNAQQETGQPGNDGCTISSVFGVPTIPVVQIIPPIAIDEERTNAQVPNGCLLEGSIFRSKAGMHLDELSLQSPENKRLYRGQI